jgi:hypothetical protein
MVLRTTGIWNMTRSRRSIESVDESTRATVRLASARNARWQRHLGVRRFTLITDKEARDIDMSRSVYSSYVTPRQGQRRRGNLAPWNT